MIANPHAASSPPPSEDWPQAVLEFWFSELDKQAWFRKDTATDTEIGDRFGLLLAWLATQNDECLLVDTDTARAAIIVLDQFPRNMFRDSPKAFAFDAQALRLATGAIALGYDKNVDADAAVFLYLPLEHSERLADQDRAVELISALGDPEYTKYAEAHRDVIRTFGRFPHRNATLGRSSTFEEQAYLAQPGSGF